MRAPHRLSHRKNLAWDANHIRGSIVVSMSACHTEDLRSIPGRGVGSELMAFGLANNKVQVALWPRVYTRSGLWIVSTRLHWGLILGPPVEKIDALPPSFRGRYEVCKHHIGTKNGTIGIRTHVGHSEQGWRGGVRTLQAGGPLCLLSASGGASGAGPRPAWPQGCSWLVFSTARGPPPCHLHLLPVQATATGETIHPAKDKHSKKPPY